jgi:heme/copper-type cytochrome/quinol oxidase subunit 2
MNRSKPIKFLKKWRRAFYAFSIVIFLACIALSIASNYLGFISLEILAITIFIVTVVLILLYFIVGRRVRAQIEKSPPSASKNRLLQVL